MKAVLAAEAALAAGALWVVWLTNRPGELVLGGGSYDRIQATGLALAVLGLAGGAAWGAWRRGLGTTLVLATASIGVTVAVGVTRLADLAPPAATLTAAAWLATAASVLVTCTIASPLLRPMSRRVVITLAVALSVSGVMAAWLGAGRGLANRSDLTGPARLALASHLLLLGVAAGVVVAQVRRRRPSGGAHPRRSHPDLVSAAAAVWVCLAMVERTIHLLPQASYRFAYGDVYRPWAVVWGLFVPLLGSLAVVGALAWTYLVRPRAERLPSGVVVVPDADPIARLRDDLAAWTGDPTLDLTYLDAAGGALGGTPVTPSDVPSADRYDRATTVVTLEHRPIGIIEHDLALARAPEALQTAAGLAGIAFHANQLLALSESRLSETRRLGERLLDADATMRDEILAELEAGPLGVVRDCGDDVRYGAPIGDVLARLRQATADVRLLSHGLYPAELIDGGLASALGDRVGAPARRLAPAVEITGFLLAQEDDTTWFEDTGAELLIHRSTPVHGAGLLDRVEVLGGHIDGLTIHLPIAEA